MDAIAITEELERYIERSVLRLGGSTDPIDPGHRIPFLWPPHPVSHDYHILSSDWTGHATLDIGDEMLEVRLAETPYGYFARSEAYFNEARGETRDESLEGLRYSLQPLLSRQRAIAEALELNGRFRKAIESLDPVDLVKVLYCSDRDAAWEASLEIEQQASTGLYGQPLITILRDTRHPYRRIAQWCVLDLFEDLPSYCQDEKSQLDAIDATEHLIMRAKDDFARTIYKAGVALGGHICTDPAAEALFRCMRQAHPVGRRSAIHAVFHLAEWSPQYKGRIIEELRKVSQQDENESLRAYAEGISEDVEKGGVDHINEPLFDWEQNRERTPVS